MPSLFRFRLLFVVAVLASGSAYALACADSGGGGGGANGDGDGGGGGLPDAEVVKSDAGTPATTMRIAHVSPQLGPVDFCYRLATTASAFDGPVLGRGIGSIKRDGGSDGGDAGAEAFDASDDGAVDAGDGDAGAASVGYRTVSRYLTLPVAGPLTIALVAPGATSCATPLFVTDVTLDPGKLSTVAIVGGPNGDGGADLALLAFIDDRMTTPSKARVRMIHAALGKKAGREASGALAARASGSQTVTIAERVEPKSAASPSAAVPVDSLGYATIVPVPSPAQLAVGAAAGASPADASVNSWVSTAGELDLHGASLHTGFILTGDTQPFEVLWCTDTSTSGEFTTCSLVR